MLKLSERSVYAWNPIEEEDHLANNLAASGKKIIRLNRGDPAVYFPTPRYIIDAYLNALKSGKTGYSFHAGIIELREAIVKRHKRLYNLDVHPDNVIVTQGVSEAILFANSLFIDQGDSAVIFRPYYPLYPDCLKLNGGTPIYVDSTQENGFRMNPDELRQALKTAKGKKIKYMIFANPSNPTGGVTRRNELKEIVDIANENEIFIISDEIYDEVVYNGAKFTSLSEVSKGIPTMIFGGASKGFDSTGFRIGYALLPESDKFSESVREKMKDFAKMRLSSNTPAEYAFADAMNKIETHDKEIEDMVENIASRVNFVYNRVNESKFLSAAKPEGAFYILAKVDMKKLNFKDDEDLSKKLLIEEGVQITRGSGFGSPDHIRIVALAPENVLDEAIRKIDKFLVRHSK